MEVFSGSVLIAFLLTHNVCKASFYKGLSRRVNRISGARQAPRKRSMSERRYDSMKRKDPSHVSHQVFEEICIKIKCVIESEVLR